MNETQMMFQFDVKRIEGVDTLTVFWYAAQDETRRFSAACALEGEHEGVLFFGESLCKGLYSEDIDMLFKIVELFAVALDQVMEERRSRKWRQN